MKLDSIATNHRKQAAAKKAEEKLLEKYNAVYVLDLKSNEIQAVKLSPLYEAGHFSTEESYTEAVLRFADKVSSAYKKDWIAFGDPAYLADYMSREDTREYVFELADKDKKLCRLTIDVLKREEGKAESLMLSFADIDNASAEALILSKRLAELDSINNYILNSFESLYYVDLDSGSWRVYKRPEALAGRFPVYEDYYTAMRRYIDTEVHPESREESYILLQPELLKQRLARNPIIGFIIRKVPDPEEKLLFCEVVRGADENHIVLGYKNITAEQKEKQKLSKVEELARQQRNLKAFGDMVNAALWTIRIDGSDRVVDVLWSDEFRRMFGFEPTVEDFPNTVEAWSSRLHPDDVAITMQNFDNSIKSRDCNGFVYDIEYRILRKSGEYCWYHAVGRMEDNGDGTRNMYGIISDISADKKLDEQQKQLQQALDAANIEAMHTEALISLNNAVKWSFLIDEKGSFAGLDYDEEKIFRDSGDKQDLTLGWLDALHPDDAGHVRSDLADAINDRSGEKTLSTSFRIMGEDGQYHWLKSAGKVIRRDDGTGEFFGMSIDITDQIQQREEQQKRLEDALAMAQSANRAKTTFLNNMSHDIRTPMNAIIGYTGLAASHIDNREQVQDYLCKISQSSDHLLSLINDVLDMSRIESGKMNLAEKEENLSDIIHTLRDMVQADIRSKQLDFFIDAVDVNDECVVCDKLRLNQVLLNILSNAIKYTAAGGTVTMRVREKTVKSNGYASYEFCVKDNGMGMDAEFLKTIFDPFTRVKSSTMSGIQGTGLGMAITKNIVDMMGGTIDIQSEPAKGTAVTICFDFRLQSAPRSPEKIPALQGVRALVADDDSNTCLSICGMLDDIDMRSEWCTSGKEAVIRAEAAYNKGDSFTVYIIDWIMPDMNGIETTRRIRKVIGEDTPIIILTAYDWSDIEEEARDAGVTAFVSKPMFPSDLHKVLNSCLGIKEESQPEESFCCDFTGKKLLLVEDNEINREIACEMLGEYGFVVDTAEDGSIALEKMKAASAGDYDIVLMDVQMPVMDGYEATRHIRALGTEISKIPILAMTANAFEEDRREALAAGMNEHIAKPINVNKLKETLTKFL